MLCIDIDAKGSVANEGGGCLRFDVLRDQSNPCIFHFYEVYTDEAASLRHREYPHFKVWSEFKATGAVVSQSVIRSDAIIFTK
jgi:(4S)-4-hydroxy-5-phosphonooxypentane-2,3-dione isomerase